MKALVLSLDGRHLVIQGPPGSGKTWTSGRLIAHLIANGKTRRRRLDEPQGDPQPARRGRGRGRRARARLPRAEEGERRQPRVVLRRARTSRTSTDVGRRAPTATSPPARRGSSPIADTRRHARLPLHRRGRAGLARRRARDGDVRAERRPRRRPAAARPGDPGHAPGRQRRLGADGTCSATTRRSRPTAASSSSARSGCTRTSAPTSRRSSTRGGSSRTPVTATRTTPLGTGLRYLAVEHDGHRQESPEEVEAVRAEVERLRAAGRRAT